MSHRSPSHAAIFALSSLLLAAPSAAHAAKRSFLTLRDDGTLAGTLTAPDDAAASVMKAYDAAGAQRPDVISVWTAFPQNRDKTGIETLFVPLGNDVTGIGLEHFYGGDGTLASAYEPVRAILLHNDFTKLESRAKAQGAPIDGFARYLFLLELSHLWGPALKVPATSGDAPASADSLIGFLFHWSFWMDAGSSPAGGNTWTDNGDSSYTVAPQSPSTTRFTPLDLYLMGLAGPSEVPPFGVLEDAVPPAGIVDPFSRRAYDRSSFPYWGTAPFTVKAKRRTITIEDVIAANGPRSPARSSGALKLGVVLMVGRTATDESIAALEEPFEAIASTLAPAFGEATGGRGSMELVTTREATDPSPADDGVDAASAPPAPPGSSSSPGCACTSAAHAGIDAASSVGTLAVLALARRRQSRRSTSTSRAIR